METRIITIFCLVDDILKFIVYKDGWQVKLTTAEIITITITASLFFYGNIERSKHFFYAYGYSKNTLSKGQFNIRLHSIDGYIGEAIYAHLASIFKERNNSNEYVVDSYPVQVCKNIRIRNSRIYKGKEYRGKSVSKREYFYGIRVHMLATVKGEPIELILAPGSYQDSPILRNFQLDIAEGSKIYADSTYTNYIYEDILKESANIDLLVSRRSNAKRQHAACVEYLITASRKTIEVAFSQVTNLLPKKIHAVTSKGFELKVICFFIAYSFTLL